MNINDLQASAGNELDSIWRQNPTLIYLLGISPVLAMTSTAGKAIVLGFIAAITTLAAVTVNRFFHQKIKPVWRFVWYLFLLASIVTLIDLCLQLTRLSLQIELGIYLPLVACNLAVLVHLEARNQQLRLATPNPSLWPTLTYSVGLWLGISVFAIVRELIVFGSLFRDWHLLAEGVSDTTDAALYSSSNQLFSFGLLQPGAFILLGLLLAAKNLFDMHYLKPKNTENKNIAKVERVRVTGKL